MAWEVDSDVVSVLAFINACTWDGMLAGGERNWKELLLKERPKKGDPGINALVAVPLAPGSAICCGQPKARSTRLEEEWMQRIRSIQTRNATGR
jgi:hypothetical protein